MFFVNQYNENVLKPILFHKNLEVCHKNVKKLKKSVYKTVNLWYTEIVGNKGILHPLAGSVPA